MNIGLAVHRYDRAEGTGRYVVELAERLSRAHDVTIYAAAHATPVPGGVTAVRVPALTSSTYSLMLTYPVGFHRVRRRHDVVHAQGWVTGRADVVTAHIVMGAWRAAAAAAGVRPPTGERWLGGFVARRERAVVRRARAVIAPSRRAAEDIARHYGRTDGVHVVHHGFTIPPAVPSRDGARSALNLPGFALIALYVGDPRKGLDAALRAVRHVDQAHLAVASHSPAAQIMERARAAGVGDRVTALGSLTDMAPAYAAADVLIHPSIYDTFGLAVAEAMAHGLPAVVSGGTGVTECLEHGVSGWVVNGNLAEGAAQALRALAGDAGARARMAQAARDAARARGWDQVAAETLAVYERAVAS